MCLLLIHIFAQDPEIETWMVDGSTQRKKSYPIYTITQQLSHSIIENILRFNALMRSNVTSSFTGLGKKKCWEIYEQYLHLQHRIGCDSSIKDAEEFVH